MRGALHAGVAHGDGGHQGEPERAEVLPQNDFQAARREL